jgi:hypothetical protein
MKGGKGKKMEQKRNRGRPKGTFTYKHPITNQSCGVYEYRRAVADIKRKKMVTDGANLVRLNRENANLLNSVSLFTGKPVCELVNEALAEFYGFKFNRTSHKDATTT